MHFSIRALVAGTLVVASGATLTALSANSAEAARRRPLPNISGAYFGSFAGDNGDYWPVDLNVTIQHSNRVGGVMQVGGRYRDVSFTGTMAPSHGAYILRLNGRSGYGRQITRMTIRATYMPPPSDDPNNIATISGTYMVRGTRREAGTLTVRGGVAR